MLLKTVAILTVLCVCLQCAKSPNVIKGKDMLGTVDFPNSFLKKNSAHGNNVVILTGEYEVRKAPNSLLFEARDNDGESSVNFFAASLDAQFNVRSASKEEWARAEPLASTRYDSYSEEIEATVAGAQYRGKTYPKTGESWESTPALPSPAGKWIVVFSHTSEKDNPSYGVLGGGGRGRGEMFIDVYDVSSGEKILSGHAEHNGGDKPSRHFDNAFWAGDGFLIVPINTQAGGSDSSGGSCLLGILPAP